LAAITPTLKTQSFLLVYTIVTGYAPKAVLHHSCCSSLRTDTPNNTPF
jgi:hypothetical protein